jgi:hypothetical protein
MPEGERDMTRDEIIRLARESGIIQPEIVFTHLERFAALVAVQVEATWQNRYLKLMDLMKAREGQPNKPCCLAEREACAKVCEELDAWNEDDPGSSAAAAIRARGQE